MALTVRQAGKATRTKGFEGHIVSQELLKDVQPALDAWEYEEAERVVKSNSEFQAAMARRGVTVQLVPFIHYVHAHTKIMHIL